MPICIYTCTDTLTSTDICIIAPIYAYQKDKKVYSVTTR